MAANFSFIRQISLKVRDIWKDGEFLKWLLSCFGQTFFQNSCSWQFRIVNAVVMLIASRSDRLTEICFFCFLRRWWQLWKKSTAVKQRYQMNSFFGVFAWLFFYCRTRWVYWFIVDVSLHVSCLIKLYPILRLCKRTIGSLLVCFSQLFSVVQLWNYTKTIIRLRLGEYKIVRQYSPRAALFMGKVK